MEDQLSQISSVWVSEHCTGCHDFTIKNYSSAEIGVGKSITSDVFVVGNCSWKILFYPDGESASADGNCSLFIELADGESNTRASLKLVILDQTGDKNYEVSDKEAKFLHKNYSWGWPKLILIDDLESSKFLKDDCVRIRLTISVFMSQKTVNMSSITLPPSDIKHHFKQLMESGLAADVKFDVNGEIFSAHRSVLAVRSSVFKAQFFGHLKYEESVTNLIKIQEIETPVFKALLHFIYCDELPDLNELDAMNPTTMYQHLLSAADRYDLDRLKLVCATHLSKIICIDNVTSTWVLADRHFCSELKECCIEFIASAKLLQAVMQTSDYKMIKESYPSSAFEFLESVVCYQVNL